VVLLEEGNLMWKLPPSTIREACIAVILLCGATHASSTRAAGWVDARVVGPLVCRADFPLAGYEDLLKDLTNLQTDLVRLLGIAPAKEPIELYLLHDKATYASYVGRYLPNVPYRRALYIKSQGPGRVFAYLSRDFEIDVRHECTHALLHASLPVVPLWLDEGLAQYFEVGGPRRTAEHPHFESTRSALRWSSAPKLAVLEGKTDVSEMGQTEYRDSWAWVHFMLEGPVEAHRELNGFLADIQHRTPPGRLSARLAEQVPQLEWQFAEHFRRGNVRDANLTPIAR
jgi:hypothetical protein